MSRSTWLGALVAAALVGLPLLYLWQRNVTHRNFRVVEDGVMYRSGQLSPPVFRRVVKELDVRTVVSFRGGDRKGETVQPNLDEEEFCRANGIEFVRFDPKHWYQIGSSVPADENVREFIRLVEERRKAGPILVHCFAGIHRTGTFTAVYRMEFNGWSRADAIAEMEECGFTLDEGGPDMLEYLWRYTPGRLRPPPPRTAAASAVGGAAVER